MCFVVELDGSSTAGEFVLHDQAVRFFPHVRALLDGAAPNRLIDVLVISFRSTQKAHADNRHHASPQMKPAPRWRLRFIPLAHPASSSLSLPVSPTGPRGALGSSSGASTSSSGVEVICESSPFMCLWAAPAEL